MKNYDDIAKSVLERRDAHNASVERRKKIILRAGVPVLTLCLAVMIGVGYGEYGKITDGPEIVDDAAVTGIDDTATPDGTDAYEHLTETYVNPPVPGGAEAGTDTPVTRPAVITDTNSGIPSGDGEDGKNYAECPTTDEYPDGGDEIWIEPHWAEKALYSKFPEFELGGVKYTTAAAWIDADKLGSVLGGTDAYGYDIYEEKSYETGVTVYEIKGIDKNAAVAVSYNGFEGKYAVYYDVWYKPATLGEFMNALSLDQNLTFGTIYYTTFEYESYMTAEYKISDPSVISDLLRDNAHAANVADTVSDFEMSFYKNAMSMSVNVDILGIENVSLAVSENGYIKTNIMGSAKLFYIGEDKTQAFMDYVKANFETVRELAPTTTAVASPVPDDAAVTAVTQISPAYDPTEAVPE